jgi:hypothetical protein
MPIHGLACCSFPTSITKINRERHQHSRAQRPPHGSEYSAGWKKGLTTGRSALFAQSGPSLKWGDDNPELRANQFSAELLLPRSIFAPKAKNLEITFASIRKRGDTFQTSLTATAIRLVEFGSFPAMVICSDAERRRWADRLHSPSRPGIRGIA